MKLNNFTINSDYTAEKLRESFELLLPEETISVNAGDLGERHIDIEVPDGVYFENVTWETSYTGANKYSGPFFEWEPVSMLFTTTFTVGQINNHTYRLSAHVMNWDSSTQSYTFWAKAKVHLSVSPF